MTTGGENSEIALLRKQLADERKAKEQELLKAKEEAKKSCSKPKRKPKKNSRPKKKPSSDSKRN